MIERKLLLILILTLPLFLLSQDPYLVVEKNDHVFEVIIPELSTQSYGVNFKNIVNNYITNLREGSITVADGPFGAQISPNYDYATLDYNSLTFVKDKDNTRASWGPRSLGNYFYDLETNGKIKIETDLGTMSELDYDITSFVADEGFLKLYRYPETGMPTCVMITVDGFTAVSDRRLKHNIKPMNTILPKVLKLRPSTYVYNGFTESSQGFIAQEVQEIFPDLVSEVDGHLAVNYTAFSTIAIQAIKEQQETIESLNDQVQSLESRLTALEKAK